MKNSNNSDVRSHDSAAREFNRQLAFVAFIPEGVSPGQAGQIWKEAVLSKRPTHVFLNGVWQGYSEAGSDLDAWLSRLPTGDKS